jgi:hypothetical protein
MFMEKGEELPSVFACEKMGKGGSLLDETLHKSAGSSGKVGLVQKEGKELLPLFRGATYMGQNLGNFLGVIGRYNGYTVTYLEGQWGSLEIEHNMVHSFGRMRSAEQHSFSHLSHQGCGASIHKFCEILD